MERGLRRRRVSAVPGARRYLEAAGHAGLERAVISASASTLPILERSRLATLIEVRIDADVIRDEELRSPPAPDLVLAALRRLDVVPSDAVAVTHSAAGTAAAHRAGVMVIGVGEGERAELLAGFGAERTVASLRELLDPRLRPPEPRA
jgi:beta-phosphoglucomutase-like phosphatase (HAD superfamily)